MGRIGIGVEKQKRMFRKSILKNIEKNALKFEEETNGYRGQQDIPKEIDKKN